jgi:hypothetical protein
MNVSYNSPQFTKSYKSPVKKCLLKYKKKKETEMCQNMVSIQQKARKPRCRSLYLTVTNFWPLDSRCFEKGMCDTNSHFQHFSGNNILLEIGEFKIFFQEIHIYFSLSKSFLLSLLLIPGITDTELAMTFTEFFFSVCKMIEQCIKQQPSDSPRTGHDVIRKRFFVCLILSDDIYRRN